MKIAGLHLENFMGYKHFKRSFRQYEVIGLVGPNKSGKTTLLEAIYWILFGVSRAERDVELIHRGEDQAIGKLTLDDDGKKIVITRGRDIKNNGMLEIKGVDKKGEVQKIINNLLGYDKDEFGLTTFFKQMDINGFMELKPAKKKEHLMQWLKNLHWKSLERAALDDLIEENKKIAGYKSKIETLKEQSTGTKKLKKQLSTLRVQHEKKTEKANALEKKIAKAKAGAKYLKEIKKQIEDLSEKVVDKEAASAEVRLKKISLAKKKMKVAQVGQPGAVDESKLFDTRAILMRSLKVLKDRILRAEKDFKGWCPLLDQSCSRIEPNSRDLKTWKRDVKRHSLELRETNAQVTHLEAWKDAQDAVKDAELALAEAKAASGDVGSMKAGLKALRATERATVVEPTGGHQDRLADLKDAMVDLAEQIGSVKQRVETSGKVRQQLSVIKEKLTACQDHAADLRYLAFMFGKNGIPSQEIENAFDKIEDEINFILRRLGIGLQVEFSPDREIGSWEDLCVACGWQFPKGTRTKECGDCGADRMKKRKDELQLRVLEDGHNEGFHMESGGGKTMVSLSVRLALTRLKQRQTNSRFNVLFLDEPDAALDKSNKKAFIQLITRTLIKEFGFEQVFWISHDPEIQESIPNVLSISKVNGESKTRWVH